MVIDRVTIAIVHVFNTLSNGSSLEPITARWAYELVQHSVEHMKPYIYDERVAGQESVDDVPDMIEWSKNAPTLH